LIISLSIAKIPAMSDKNPANNKIIQLRIIYLIVSFLVFLAGLAIYIFFRSNNIILFNFFPKPSFLDNFPIPIAADNIWKYMFLFNLPDGLWFLSGLLLIRAVWLINKKWQVVYSGIFVIIALTMEISQLSVKIPGTFDWLDILFMAFFAFVESLIFILFIKKRVIL